MPIEVDLIPAGAATSRYLTYNDLINRWGEKNVVWASNKQKDDVNPNVAGIQASMDFACDEIDASIANLYQIPLVFSAGLPEIVRRWANVLTYADLYTTRGLMEKDKTGDRLKKLVDYVYNDLRLYRLGLRALPAQSLTTSAGNLVSPGPVSIGRTRWGWWSFWREPDESPTFQ